jgi:hemerythrin-like metal-binding protein
MRCHMEWGDNCQHGIIWQDFQHKQLVNIINGLLDSIIIGSGDKETFYKTIKFLKEFTYSHLGIEELYMRKYEFPGMRAHLAEHKFFIGDLNKFISVCIYHEQESSVELLNKLNTWFFHHTQTTDKILAEFILKNRLV